MKWTLRIAGGLLALLFLRSCVNVIINGPRVESERGFAVNI